MRFAITKVYEQKIINFENLLPRHQVVTKIKGKEREIVRQARIGIHNL